MPADHLQRDHTRGGRRQGFRSILGRSRKPEQWAALPDQTRGGLLPGAAVLTNAVLPGKALWR
jgi:hypothetical protein